MNEVANTTKTFKWTLEPDLVEAGAEIRGYYKTAKLSYLQIGKKLLEIKDRFEHGEWENFLEANTKMSVRGAQQCMQAYKAYGFDTRYIEIGQSKGIVMLPMSEKERERLFNENDVDSMSVQGLKRKIREIREEEAEKRREAVEAERTNGKIQLAKAMERAEADKEKAVQAAEAEAKETVNKAWSDARAKVEEATARANEAEKRAFEAESRPTEIVRETVADPALVAEVQQYREEVERLKTQNEEMIAWSREKARMQAELEENERTIAEQQAMLNEQKKQILGMKSAQKRGEDPAGSDLTLDTYQRVTRECFGYLAIVPQMGAMFDRMEKDELRKWKEPAETLYKLMRDSLSAMGTVFTEGGYSIE